jgi:hypothetical protein
MRWRSFPALVMVAGTLVIIALAFTARELRTDLVQGGGRDFSDFPFSIAPQSQKLAGLEPKEEPKAVDNPIGLAEVSLPDHKIDMIFFL